MKKRSIYIKNSIGKLNQGTIFSGCMAEEYPGLDVYGVIITPRCDIENNKVATIHYLPVVKFSDWVVVDFWRIFVFNIKNQTKGAISGILKNNGLSPSIIEKIKPEQILQLLKNKIKKNDYEKTCELFEKISIIDNIPHSPTPEQLGEFIKSYSKVAQTIFKEIKENKRKEYYLLEDWDNTDDFYVVLLREIKNISFEVGSKIAKGMYESELNENDRMKNHLTITDQRDGLFYPLVQINSPFIEHLIQLFFQNFGRIGIDDHELELEIHLLEKCKI